MADSSNIRPSDTVPTTNIPKPTPALEAPSSNPEYTSSAKSSLTWPDSSLTKSDAFISHLDRLLSTPSGTDALLNFLCYSTLTTSTLLKYISLHRLRTSARKLIESAVTLPADTTIIVKEIDIIPPRTIRASQSLKALSSLISDFRIFVRLWGLLGLYTWGRSIMKNPPTDRLFRRIAWAQVTVNVAFQVLENGAYLASKGVLGWDAKKQAKAWAWSSRFWAAHVALDFLRLMRERRIRQSKKKTVQGTVADEPEQILKWNREVLANSAYAPLTVHWSLEKGTLSEIWVGIFGTIAGATAFSREWKKVAT